MIRLLCIGWIASLVVWVGNGLAAESVRNLGVRAPEAAGGPRVALVIGNSAYPGVAALKNPANDAKDVAAKLNKLDFQVILKTNVGLREMLRTLTEFGERIRNGSEVLFFYAGHGMQVRGKNYLIPVDAEIRTESAVSSEAVDVDQLLDKLAPARLSMVILDACRNNPFERRFRGGGQGLASINAPTGTLIAYATAPGKVASDGSGRNGLYTQELLAAIDVPGIKVEDVFKRVRSNVVRKSGDAQIPWESSSLTGDFYFLPVRNDVDRIPAAGQGAALGNAEAALWEAVERGGGEDDYTAYLQQFPNGVYAVLAGSRLARLRERTVQAAGEEERKRAAAEAERRGRFQSLLDAGDGYLAAKRRKDALAKFEEARALFPDAPELAERLRRARALSAAGDIFRDTLKDGTQGPEMVVIPAGAFRMGDIEGSADHYAQASVPVREVHFQRPFALGRFEITFDEFDKFAAATGRNRISDHGWGRGRRPANKITWDEAIAYVTWLSAQTGKRYRIPSEAEWEYAARAGTATNFWWGNEPSHEYANYGTGQPGWFPSGTIEGKDRWEYTAPVGQFPPNPFGLHDMQGNIWEWVADCWAESYAGAPTDGRSSGGASCENRVMRGGSWGYNPDFMRASSRIKVFWGVLSFLHYGIRVARDVDE